MNTEQIAQRLVELCRKGEYEQAQREFSSFADLRPKSRQQRPSSASGNASVVRRTGSATILVSPGGSAAAAPAPAAAPQPQQMPRSFQFIGGRMVPVYRR